MPTFALVTPHGSCLGPLELDDDETYEGALIVRDGQPVRRVLRQLEIPEDDG